MAIVFEELMVQYPMPAWCVPHVTKFLSDLDRTRSEPKIDERLAIAESPPATSGWTVDDLRRLKPLIKHNKVAMAMLDLASEKPSQYIAFPDACARAGLETSQGRSGIGALTKVCNRIGKQNQWPVKYEWAGNGEQVACYIMTPEVAELWRQVSAE